MTLIEALVVMALTAMLSAVAFPRFDDALDRLRLSQASAMIASDLKRARGEAQRRGAASFAVGADGGSYAVAAGRAVALPDGARLSTRDGRPLAFFADGSSTGGVLLLQEGRRRMLLSVDAATGLVQDEPRGRE